MWNNTETKRSPKQPDYKCKNKQCDKAVWLEKKGAVPSYNGNGHAPVHVAAGAAMGPLYAECLEFATKAVTHYVGKDAPPEAIVAAAATLFIQACNSGRPIRAAKPAPAPPPPPPPAPVYDELAPLPF
jgi:hypothetical protein